MEFRYRAGEERGPSSSSSNGYFAEQALQAGLAIGSSGLIPPRMSRADALLEELRKEQIREELIAREIAHRRMLEEEIRRELEVERRLAKRLEEDRLLPLEMEASVGLGVGERLGSGIVPRCLEIQEDKRSPSLGMPGYRDFRTDERTVPLYGDVGAFERSPAPQKNMVGKMGPSKLLSKPGVSGSKNNKLSDHNVSGVKRKAASELPRPCKKEWSCSLCHVSATSQKTLNIHLKGKKHKAKEAQLTHNKATSKKLNASSSMEKEGDVPLGQAKGTSAKNPSDNIDTEGKKQQNKRSKAVWCDLCKVKCNSPAMLDCHLKGKKHKAQEESKKGDGVGTAEVVKEVTDQNEQDEEVKAEDNTEATDHKGKEEEVNVEVDAKANGNSDIFEERSGAWTIAGPCHIMLSVKAGKKLQMPSCDGLLSLCIQ